MSSLAETLLASQDELCFMVYLVGGINKPLLYTTRENVPWKT
jgi:hypothetical protein